MCHTFPLEVPPLRPKVHHASTELSSFVKLLFRNLPHISLCIYIHIITTWALLLESYAHSAGLWAAERFCTRSGYSSSAEKCRDQHSSSRTVQHRWEGPGLPPGRHYVQGWGRLGRGHVPLQSQVRRDPPPKAETGSGPGKLLCPWFCLQKRIKAVPSGHLPQQIKESELLGTQDSFQAFPAALLSSFYLYTFSLEHPFYSKNVSISS